VEDERTAGLVRARGILELRAEDPFFERAQEIKDLIARRAYELFEARGGTHGHDQEDWLRAESEILLRVPVEVSETEDYFTVRAHVARFSENCLEVRVANRSLCITGRREQQWPQTEGQIIHSERLASQIFRVLDLPSQLDADKVNASLTDGVLEIRVTKTETGRKVPVLTRATAA
jgi:HSP20 family protein